MIGPGFSGHGRKSLFIWSALASGSFMLVSAFPPSSGFSRTTIGPQTAADGNSASKDRSRAIQPNSIKVGMVEQHVDGCSLQLPADYRKQNDRNVFNSSDENSSEDCECAFMNLDGREIRLKRVYSKWVPPGDDRVGKRGIQIYKARDTKVEVDWVVTHVCGPRDGEDCEDTEFSAIIKITRPGTSTTLNVRGGCGP